MADSFCEKCGSPIRYGDKFCEECGAPLTDDQQPAARPLTCSRCGAALEEGDVFCPECGTRADEPAEDISEPNEQPEADDPVRAYAFCENCGAPLAEGDLFCGGCGVKSPSPPECAELSPPPETFLAGYTGREDPSPEQGEMTPGKQPEEFLDRVDRTAPKKSGPLKLIACVLLVLAVIGGFIFAGRYYYLAYYNPRDSAGAKHPAPPKRAEVSPGQDFASGESRSLEKRGLLWTPADANGYSFLAPSDPTRVFSSPPSLSARASRGADLRAEPNEGSEAVNRLNSGESVEIAQRHLSPGGKSTWYRVVGNSELDGWIRGGDIEFIY